MTTINRREAIGAAVGCLSLSKTEATPAPRERPWAKRAAGLELTEGAYADYCAWREWFDRKADIVIGENELDRVTLYGLMCDLADGAFGIESEQATR